MKRSFLGLILICMVVLSCKKQGPDNNNKSEPGKGQYAVTFSVGFSQQTSDFKINSLKTNNNINSLATTALAGQVDVLYLAVYNEDGSQLHVIKQLSTDDGFGTFVDNLNGGTYTIVVAAGKTGLALTKDFVYRGGSGGFGFVDNNSLNTDILMYDINTSGSFPYPGFFNKDAFYKKIALTVPRTGTQSVSLDRITSQVQVVVEDAIPANAKTIGLEISTLADKFYIGNATTAKISQGSKWRTNSSLVPADIGKTNHTFSTVPFLALPLSDQTIVCSTETVPAGSENLGILGDISSSIVPNVTCLPNKKTVLTGNLFGGNGKPVTNGFHLMADTSWNATPIKKPF